MCPLIKYAQIIVDSQWLQELGFPKCLISRFCRTCQDKIPLVTIVVTFLHCWLESRCCYCFDLNLNGGKLLPPLGTQTKFLNWDSTCTRFFPIDLALMEMLDIIIAMYCPKKLLWFWFASLRTSNNNDNKNLIMAMMNCGWIWLMTYDDDDDW